MIEARGLEPPTPAPKAWVQFINPYFNYTYGDARCVLCH